jgi:hypothetical protein
MTRTAIYGRHYELFSPAFNWKNNKGKGVLDYSMSQITQIVESNNGKLLVLYLSLMKQY